ncbi:MAG: hypothetical protein K0U24_07595 [Gammaproteobacteria bacterium]|nr:hypothetical protein [Gammaproteobacteria bacterium]
MIQPLSALIYPGQKQYLRALSQSPEDQRLLESVRLFTHLPPAFFAAYLNVQASTDSKLKPITLPTIMQDKSETLCSYFNAHESFNRDSGPLHTSKWEALGRASQAAYEAWLDESMLFAFSHGLHYCEAPQILDAELEKNQPSLDPKAKFYFKALTSPENTPKTNILSVTGFEFRNYTGNPTEQLAAVKEHSKKTMQQILMAAEATQTTDIVFIPYGMGVFLPGGARGEALKNEMLDGMSQALKAYTGTPVKLHCCAFYERLLADGSNRLIEFEDQSGKDAYVLANTIQDAPEQSKSMLINAGDNDWTAMLDVKAKPGQFSNGHTLYHSTSDEYYGLVTAFSHASIARRHGTCSKSQFQDKITSTAPSISKPAVAPDLKITILPKQVVTPPPSNYSFLLNCLNAMSAALAFFVAVLSNIKAKIVSGFTLITNSVNLKLFQPASETTRMESPEKEAHTPSQ